MQRKPISIRMSTDDVAWLGRDGRTLSAQWRRDINQLRRLQRMAASHPHIPIGEAVSLTENPENKS